MYVALSILAFFAIVLVFGHFRYWVPRDRNHARFLERNPLAWEAAQYRETMERIRMLETKPRRIAAE